MLINQTFTCFFTIVSLVMPISIILPFSFNHFGVPGIEAKHVKRVNRRNAFRRERERGEQAKINQATIFAWPERPCAQWVSEMDRRCAPWTDRSDSFNFAKCSCIK